MICPILHHVALTHTEFEGCLELALYRYSNVRVVLLIIQLLMNGCLEAFVALLDRCL